MRIGEYTKIQSDGLRIADKYSSMNKEIQTAVRAINQMNNRFHSDLSDSFSKIRKMNLSMHEALVNINKSEFFITENLAHSLQYKINLTMNHRNFIPRQDANINLAEQFNNIIKNFSMIDLGINYGEITKISTIASEYTYEQDEDLLNREVDTYIEDAVDELSSSNNIASSINTFINSIVQTLTKINDEKFKRKVAYQAFKLIITIVLSLVSSFIYDTIVNKSVETKSEQHFHYHSHTKQVKIIKFEIKNVGFPEKYLSDIRIVKRNSLKVYKGKHTKTNVIGLLDVGDTVRIIKKSKNWSLVYFAKDDYDIEGWTHTRYLEQVK